MSKGRMLFLFVIAMMSVIVILLLLNKLRHVDDDFNHPFHSQPEGESDLRRSSHQPRITEVIRKVEKERIQPKYTSEQFQAGMNVLLYGRPDLTEAKEVFQHVRRLGINSVAINFPFYQEDWKANEVKKHPVITPSDAELQAVIKVAHEVGLATMLRPIMDEDSFQQSGKWRGQIQPKNPDAWFDSYRLLLLDYAELAQMENVKLLNIGTELNSLQNQYSQRWKEMIADIREIYQGELIYSFNWDVVHDIPANDFIDKLDHVGIDAYFPLDLPDGATVKELEEAWQKKLDHIKGYFQHPSMIVTEAGIIPYTGAYRAPYSWSGTGRKLDFQEQANYYEATFHVWKPFIQGMYWWNISLNQAAEEISFSPLYSPTEDIIKQHFLKSNK